MLGGDPSRSRATPFSVLLPVFVLWDFDFSKAVFTSLKESSNVSTTSYYKMSLALHRRQPTLNGIRTFLKQQFLEHLEYPTLAATVDHFPGGCPMLVKAMYDDVCRGCRQSR